MELKHLSYFRAAVEEGSLQGAAARLNVAQPALSRRVRDLEAELGCQLLERGARGITPTRAGMALYRDTVRMFDDLQETRQRVRRLGLEHGHGVRVGLAPTIARKYPFLGSALDAFASQHRDSTVAFRPAGSAELVGNLREGAIDLALLYEQRADSTRTSDRLVHREAYVLAVHPAHPLAVAGAAELADLTGQPLVWLARQDMADRFNPMALQLRRHGLEPAIAQIVDTFEQQIDITIASAGVCLTPASTRLSVPAGKLHFRALPRLDTTIDLTLIWPSDGVSEKARDLLDLLHAEIDRHQADLARPDKEWMILDGHPLYHLSKSKSSFSEPPVSS